MKTGSTTSVSPAAVRSCDQCRFRKVKCGAPSLDPGAVSGDPESRSPDNADNRCKRCIFNNLPCTYRDTPRKRGPPTGKRLRELQARTENGGSSSPPSTISTDPAQSHKRQRTSDRGPSCTPEDDYEEIYRAVDDYFSFYHGTCPVLSQAAIRDGLTNGKMSEQGFRCLIWALLVLDLACKYRKEPSTQLRDAMLARIDKVEELRRSYDFAASPVSTSTVITSLFLFIGYSVLEKHNRSFLLLSEAISLYDWTEEPQDETDRVHWLTLECVLFVTESATCEIYGRASQRRFAKRPSPATLGALLDHYNITGTSEEQAALLLQYLMTYIHSCTSVEDLMNVGPLLPLSAFPVQAADVAVTKQWRLAQLVAARAPSTSASYSDAQYLQEMGAMTLASVASLTDGEKRVVGVGKIAAIAQVLIDRSASMDTSGYNLVDQLLKLVSRLDVEERHIGRLRATLATVASLSSLSRPLLGSPFDTSWASAYTSPPAQVVSQSQIQLLSEFEEMYRLLGPTPAGDRIEVVHDKQEDDSARAGAPYMDVSTLLGLDGYAM